MQDIKILFLEIGATAIYTAFDATYQKPDAIYNTYLFNGKQLFNYGLNYAFTIKNILAFGETGMSDNGGYATQNGLLIALDEHLSLGLLYRYYSHNYQSLKANAFANGTLVNNETGMYYSAQVKINTSVSLSAYYDLFKHKWFKYQVNGPSAGDDMLIQLTATPNKKTQYYIRARNRSTPENNMIDLHHYSVSNYKQTNIRFDASYTVTEKIKLHSRAEYVLVNKDQRSEGVILLQDASYAHSNKLSFTVRYAIFDSDNYDSRVYAYENDIPNYFYIPSFYENGSRYYAMVHYQLNRFVSVWLRFSQTLYYDKQTIGQGATQINNSSKSDFKALIRITI